MNKPATQVFGEDTVREMLNVRMGAAQMARTMAKEETP